MNSKTLLTCTEFIASSTENQSLLLMFRTNFLKSGKELKNLKTLSEWKSLFNKFKNQ